MACSVAVSDRDRRTPSQRKRAFLAAFAGCGTVLHAAEAAGINRRQHQRWMHDDAEYAKAFEDAKADVLEVVEREIFRRAVEGWDEPVFNGGRIVGEVRKRSDVLLIFLAKALAPNRYRDNHRIEHTGADGGPITHEHELGPAAKQALFGKITAMGQNLRPELAAVNGNGSNGNGSNGTHE